MKKTRTELNVDSIGTQDSALTKNEEKSISDYIKSRKEMKTNKQAKSKIDA